MVSNDYTGKTVEPNLPQIHTDVAASAMTNKNIQGCRWDDDVDVLKVFFDAALSGADKTILDGIV